MAPSNPSDSLGAALYESVMRQEIVHHYMPRADVKNDKILCKSVKYNMFKHAGILSVLSSERNLSTWNL